MRERDLPAPFVLRRLATVFHTRLSGAERVMQKELHELRKLEQEIRDRQVKVDKLIENLLEVQTFQMGQSEDSAASPGVTHYQLGLNRRFWIDYDLQRERYYLDMTCQEYSIQTRKVDDKRKIYIALKYRYEAITEKLRCSRLLRDLRKNQKHEAERQNQLHRTAMQYSHKE